MSSASEGEDLRRVHLRERVSSASEGEDLRKGPSEGEGESGGEMPVDGLWSLEY